MISVLAQVVKDVGSQQQLEGTIDVEPLIETREIGVQPPDNDIAAGSIAKTDGGSQKTDNSNIGSQGNPNSDISDP